MFAGVEPNAFVRHMVSRTARHVADSYQNHVPSICWSELGAQSGQPWIAYNVERAVVFLYAPASFPPLNIPYFELK